MNTKCIIVDDEPLALNLLRSHLGKIDFIEIIAECRSAFEAMDILRKESVDLIFLDINMPKLTGLELLKTLIYPPRVIITTAYREYAIEGYELNVVDYLLKPISFDRFLKAVNKFYMLQNSETANGANSSKKDISDFIFIQDGKTVHKTFVNEILYMEGYGEYVRIHTINRVIVARTTLSDLEARLKERGFARIHKSYIVSLDRISSFTVKTVTIGKEFLPIGRSYKEELFEILDYNRRIGKIDSES